MSIQKSPTPPPTDLGLHAGDHFTPQGYDVDLEVISVVDHTQDAIGQTVYELVDTAGYLWFLIGGVAIKGGVR